MATKKPAKKKTAKKATAKKTVKKSSRSVAKAPKKTAKKAPAKKTTAKKSVKKAPAKKAVKKVVKKSAKKVAKKPVKKAPKKVVKKAPAKKVVKATKATPAKKAVAKAPAKAVKAEKPAPPKKVAPPPPPPPPKPLKPLPQDFLDEMRTLLLAERTEYEEQLEALTAEAEQLASEHEPGDVEFSEEGGEGDALAIERERDLALSAQARQAMEEIDHALSKIDKKIFGYCENCRNPIPKARLKALPFAELCVDCKQGGLARRLS